MHDDKTVLNVTESCETQSNAPVSSWTCLRIDNIQFILIVILFEAVSKLSICHEDRNTTQVLEINITNQHYKVIIICRSFIWHTHCYVIDTTTTRVNIHCTTRYTQRSVTPNISTFDRNKHVSLFFLFYFKWNGYRVFMHLNLDNANGYIFQSRVLLPSSGTAIYRWYVYLHWDWHSTMYTGNRCVQQVTHEVNAQI